MAARRARRAAGPKRWALFWVTTDDGSEDCFVVAHSARSAARFFEGSEGYDPGDSDVDHVIDLPEALQGASGWREAPDAPVVQGASYASDALIIACGGEVASQRSNPMREVLGVVLSDYRFGDRHFRAGDVSTMAHRALGVPEPARLSAFRGDAPRFPEWWEWELELTPHLEKRMADRDFTEVDLRSMLESATSYRVNAVEDRFVIETRFRGRAWEVIVEPDASEKLLVVVTAFGVDR